MSQFQKLLISKEKQHKERSKNDVFMSEEFELYDIINYLKIKQSKSKSNDIIIEKSDMINEKFVEYAITSNCLNSMLEMEKVLNNYFIEKP